MTKTLKPATLKRRQYMREWYQKNREHVVQRQSEYQKTCPKVKEYKQEYYQKNKEKYKSRADTDERRAQMKVYYRDNKDKWLKRYRTLYHSDPAFRLSAVLRGRLRRALRRYFNGAKIKSAARDLGCTIPEFIEYISSRFLPGMSWDNFGDWQLDHIKPLSSFDLIDLTQQSAALHYSNFQPLWRRDNLKKGSKVEGDHDNGGISGALARQGP